MAGLGVGYLGTLGTYSRAASRNPTYGVLLVFLLRHALEPRQPPGKYDFIPIQA